MPVPAGDPGQIIDGRLTALETHVPPQWGSAWRLARAKALAGTGKARVHILGASVARGYYASDLESKGWAALVRAGLQATYGDGGSGFRGVFDSKLYLDASDGNTAKSSYYGAVTNNLWTLTGSGWSNINFVFGPTGTDAILTTTGGDTASIKVRGTTATIYTLDAGDGTGTWTYKIDGGSAVTVNAPAVFGVRKTVIPGLTAGEHTVLVTLTSGFLMVCGVSGENTTGAVVNNISKSGTVGFQWIDPSGPFISADWAGGVNYPTDLLIFNLAENDIEIGGTSVDDAVQYARRIFDRVRDTATANGQVDLAILLDHAGTYDASNYRWHDLAAKLRALAATYGAAMFDMWADGKNSWNYWNTLAYWGNPANPATAGTDFIHLSNAGHAHVAQKVLNVLTS